MDNVGADVVVDLVEDAVVVVERREAPPEVGPLLTPVPGDALPVLRAVVVHVRHEVEPGDEDEVGHEVQAGGHGEADLGGREGQEAQHARQPQVGLHHEAPFALGEERPVGVVVGAAAGLGEVEGVEEQGRDGKEAHEPEEPVERPILGLGSGDPALVELDVPVVRVVRPGAKGEGEPLAREALPKGEKMGAAN